MTSLREQRESLGLSQRAVATAVHVSVPTYIRYEKTPEVMTVDKAMEVCNFLGCDIRDIFFGSELSKTHAN